MFLKAGAVSLVLLLASRVLGLVRESAQAAAFGASAEGDISVLVLSLPDLLAGLLASGALAYVLLPAWAGAPAEAVAANQRRVARWLLVASGLLALGAWAAVDLVAAVLLPGLPPEALAFAAPALRWSAVALPAAFLAALWTTRLQHERDFLGAYGANVVANGLVVAVLFSVAGQQVRGLEALMAVGVGLLLAVLGRLVWLRARLRMFSPSPSGERSGWGHGEPGTSSHACPHPHPPPGGEGVTPWLWAIAAAGLPLALPFAARSLASQSGEGALAIFNYAWKLVELPLQLAIQLVATLALGPIAQALARDPQGEAATAIVRRGFALAWALACACAAALLVGAPAIAQLLFGWGRMQPAALGEMAAWARVGAWSLLPQALAAVGLAVLAARRGLRVGALAYAVALAALLLGRTGQGQALMGWLVGLYAGVALAVLAAIGADLRRWLPARALLVAVAVLGLAWFASLALPPVSLVAGLALAAVAAVAVLGTTWLATPELRQPLG